MLVFSTKLPLKKEVTKKQCVDLFLEWVINAYRYPFIAEDFAEYDRAGDESFELTKGIYTFSITHYRDENVTLSACRLVTEEKNNVWTTQNVVYNEGNCLYLSVQTHCTQRTYYDKLPKANPPYTIKLFIRNHLCALDGVFPVTDQEISVTDDYVLPCGSSMQGKGKDMMPLVYVSSNSWPMQLDTKRLARELQGMAHVLLEPSRECSDQMREASNGNNVYLGYVGIYFPGQTYHRKFSEEAYPRESAGEKLLEEIKETVRNVLLNRADSTKYSWDQIKALQHKQRASKIQLESADELDELREWKKNFENETERLEKELQEVREARAQLYNQNESLQAILDSYRFSDAGTQKTILASGVENDLYPGEQKNLVLEILQQRLATLRSDSRPYHIIQGILAANEQEETGVEIEETIRRVFTRNGGSITSKSLQRELESVGFRIEKGKTHPKLIFGNDERYSFTVPSTPSDHRDADNVIAQICNVLFLRN